MALPSQCLSIDEEAQIHQQLQRDTWRPNKQVLWSGIPRDEAQHWADKHGMQTLTTAMGALMDPSHPLCLRKKKSKEAWSKYMKGASAIFAWYISRGEKVTVLSPPPPERFHPSGQTNYQTIEEPIVKGLIGANAVSQIEMVHPSVKGAEDIFYQIWPVDNTTTWTAIFGEPKGQKQRWRMVKTMKDLSNQLGGIEITKAHQEAKEREEKGQEKSKEKAKPKQSRKSKKQEKKVKKDEKATEKARKEAEKVKMEKASKAKEEEEKAKMEKTKTRNARKERKKARKAKKERKRAKKEAKRLEKKEKDYNQGRLKVLS